MSDLARGIRAYTDERARATSALGRAEVVSQADGLVTVRYKGHQIQLSSSAGRAYAVGESVDVIRSAEGLALNGESSSYG